MTITVKDNGVGMSKETLNRCGEMFYTTKTNGTGIGVSLANTIIERHNGTIQYQSEEASRYNGNDSASYGIKIIKKRTIKWPDIFLFL